MSKKIFSTKAWENVPSEIREERSTTSPTVPVLLASNENIESDVERIVCVIEQRAIDIAPDYKQWVDLGFALAEGLGERGRDYYHRLSRFHADYQQATTDKQFTHCLQGRGQGITIRSFFHLASEAGIPLTHPEIPILPNIQNGKTGMDKAGS